MRKFLVVILILSFGFSSCKTNQKVSLTSMSIEAKKEAEIGNIDKAENLYNKILKINSKYSLAYFELSKISAYQKNDLNEAIELIDKAITIDNKNIWYIIEKADYLYEQRLFKESAVLYEEITDQQPKITMHYYKWADASIKARNIQGAIDAFDKMETVFGMSKDLVYKKEELYSYIGKPQKSIEELEKYLAAFPSSTETMGRIAEIYTNLKNDEKAFEYLNKILEVNPKEAFVHLSLANYYLQKADSINYINELKIGIENKELDIDSKVKVLLRFYEIIEENPKLKPSAIPILNGLIAAHPNSPISYSMLGDFYLQVDSLELAKNAFINVVELDNSKFLIWDEILKIDYKLGNYQSLQENATKAFEYFPEHFDIYYYLSYTYYHQDNFREAYKWIIRGEAYIPQAHRLIFNYYTLLPEIAYKVKEYDKAWESFEKAIEILPRNYEIMNSYATYLAQQNTNLAKAEELAEYINQISTKENANYQATYAFVLFKKNDYNGAAVWIEKALKLGNPSMKTYEYAGDIFYMLNDINKALGYWNKAKELDIDKKNSKLDKKIADKKYYE